MSDCDTISQIVHLISLSEEEEEAIRSVFEEDLRLQQEEENRLKQLHDDIDALKKQRHVDDACCSCCGVRFGVITNRGASCPICSRRVCKQHRLFGSCSGSWMCTLCDMRKRLSINEEVLSASVDDVFYVSFSDDITQQEHSLKHKQHPKHLQQNKGRTHKECHLQKSVESKRQHQKQLKPDEKVVNHSSVKSPDRAISTNHLTCTTKKQPQTTTTTCRNINKPKITNFTKSLLRSSIKHSLSAKGSNQKATQVHPEVDNRQDAEKVKVETSFPSMCDKKIKNEEEFQAPTKRTISPTRKRKKADTPEHIGELRVMIQFVPDTNKSGKEKGRGSLNVWIQQARGLPASCDQGTYLLCTLLPRGKYEKFKSAVVQCDTNPTYNTMYQFDKVTDVELSYDRVLEITLWEPHRSTNEFVGGVRLGPKPQAGNKNKWMDSVGSEISQWEAMLADPNQWIDGWHPLRHLMKK